MAVVNNDHTDDVDILGDEDEYTVKMTKGRLSGSRFIITYPTHLDKPSTVDFMNECAARFSKVKVLECHIAHETGEKGDYPHTHVCLWVKPRFDNINWGTFFNVMADGKELHPNVKEIKTSTKHGKLHWIRAVRYLMKEDRSNNHLALYMAEEYNKLTLGMAGFVDIIQSKPTLTEAYKEASQPNEILAIRAIYQDRPVGRTVRVRGIETLHPWQQVVIDEMEIRLTKQCRLIKWYYDKRGGCGKSVLCRLAVDRHKADVSVIRNVGRVIDFAENVRNHIESTGQPPRIFLFDFARALEHSDSIYTALEQACDGTTTATKYKGSTVNFDTDHVFVFANFYPDVRKMSMDRWLIRSLTDSPDGIQVEDVSAFSLLREDDGE